MAGAFVTAILQSSTATGLMAASFVTAGTLDLVPALAVMLGANVGTTLVVQILSFNITAVTPVLLLSGVIAFKRGGRTRTRDLGRALIGRRADAVGAAYLSRRSRNHGRPAVSRALVGAISDQPLLCLIIVAAVTWAAHSSVGRRAGRDVARSGASGLADSGTRHGTRRQRGQRPEPADRDQPARQLASRRLPIGNLLTRLVGCALVLPFLHPIADTLQRYEPNPARLAADFHTAFTSCWRWHSSGLLMWWPHGYIRWLPEQAKSADPGTPVYLDSSATGRSRRGAGLRRPRGSAHGRPDRSHAAAIHEGVADQ